MTDITINALAAYILPHIDELPTHISKVPHSLLPPESMLQSDQRPSVVFAEPLVVLLNSFNVSTQNHRKKKVSKEG